MGLAAVWRSSSSGACSSGKVAAGCWRRGVLTALALALGLLVFGTSGRLRSPPTLGSIKIRSGTTTTTAATAVGRSVGAQLSQPLTAPGLLFSWGLNAHWRLGRLGGDTTHVPAPILAGQRVVSAAASRHSLAVTEDGEVWSFGANDSSGGGGHGSPGMMGSGQLGRGGGQRPGRVGGELEGRRVVQVAAGRYHSVAVTSDGAAFTWGLNDWGQLGREGEEAPQSQAAAAAGAAVLPGAEAACTWGPRCRSGRPGRVPMPEGAVVVGASAGRYSTQLITADGQLYVFGLDGCATSGTPPPRAEVHIPRRVTGDLSTRPVTAIATGYVFWAAVTSDGGVWTCATGDDGYGRTLPLPPRQPNAAGELGRSGTPGVPARVPGIAGRATGVAAGREHALAVTEEGVVYSWGGGRERAVLGRAGPHGAAAPVGAALAGAPARLVAAGEYFSLAATADGRLFGWGTRDYGATATAPAADDGKAISEPTPVLGSLGGPKGPRVVALAAGYQHALAIVEAGEGAAAVAVGGTGGAGGGQEAAVVEVVRATPPKAPQQQQQEEQQDEQETAGDSSSGTAAAPTLVVDPTSYLEPQSLAPNYTAASYWAAWQPGPLFEGIKRLAPDVIAGLPRAFNPAYRNPCWGEGAGLTCIPFFHIIGVSKCGTTDLYNRLVRHRGVVAARNKGPHFWDECPYPPRGPCGVGGSGDFAAYVKLFSMASDIIRSRSYAVTGEASSNTYTSANGVFARGPAAARPDGVTLSMPLLLRETAPYLRLILMLREPGDRLYSAYHYYRWWLQDAPPPSPEDFHNKTVADIAAWRACVAARGTAACIRSYEPQQLIKGMYSEFLQDWLLHWPRDQLLVIRYEDYTAATEPHLRAALQFLGALQPPSSGTEQGELAIGDSLAEIAAAPVSNKSGGKRVPMLAETRALLDEFYAPFNERLAAALGGDRRWRWDPGERRGARSAGSGGSGSSSGGGGGSGGGSG